ncbi:MAG: ABC transporter permease subunit [Gemmataceae bacterium]
MFAAMFQAEMLRAARRGHAHVLRWCFAGWLVLQILYFFQTEDAQRFSTNARQFVNVLLIQQFVILALVTPAFAAGAITDEKARDTLESLFTTHLGSAAIVGGKLVARALQVALLGLATLPVVAFFGPFGGVPPEFVVVFLAVSVLLLFAVSSVSLLASVWTRQTRTAVIAVYAVIGALVFLRVAGFLPVPDAIVDSLNPLRPLETAYDRANPAEVARRLALATIAFGTISVVSWLIASWRLKAAYMGQLQARPRGRLAFVDLDRPRPSNDALSWKEHHVGRRLPRWLTLPTVFAAGAGITLAVAGRQVRAYEIAHIVYWAVLAFSAMVGVRASGTIVGERERQTWDGLLTTPWSFGELVRGKLHGIVRATWPYVLAFDLGVAAVCGASGMLDLTTFAVLALALAAVATAICYLKRPISPWAIGALTLAYALVGGLQMLVVFAVGLLVVWLAMNFLGSVGLWCSARASSSWRSLMQTMSIGYLGGVVLSCVGMPLGCVTGLILLVLAAMLEAVARAAGTQSAGRVTSLDVLVPFVVCAGIGFAYWWVARLFVIGAEQHLERMDRIPSGYVRHIAMNQPMRPFGPTRRRRE